MNLNRVMPAEGRDSRHRPSLRRPVRDARGEVHDGPDETRRPPDTVTTGPIAGSRKIYTSPEGRPDILVPFREIALDPLGARGAVPRL